MMKNCVIGEPVFLTKNGRGKFAIMDIEDYEREKAAKKLLMKLQEAETTVKDEIDLNELAGGDCDYTHALSYRNSNI